jgi:glutaredoxin
MAGGRRVIGGGGRSPSRSLAKATTATATTATATTTTAAKAASWVVYGYEHCPWCVQARQLLASRGVSYTWRPMVAGSLQSEAIKSNHQWPTVPIVLRNGVLVGGFADLSRRLSKSGAL